MQKRQGQTETQNPAPENQPPAGMAVPQNSLDHPPQCEQASPFEQEGRSRRDKEEGQGHFDFPFCFFVGVPAAVWRMSLRSAALMSEVSIN